MSDTQALHHYLEASALAFADRAAYLGDRAFVDVPDAQLLCRDFAAERACLVDPARAAGQAGRRRVTSTSADGVCRRRRRRRHTADDTENVATTNLTVADRWGNVVSYTLTIEQTGGSGIVVPGRGFLLNNELTDFSLDLRPRRPQPDRAGQAPAQLDVADDRPEADGKPVLALGSPGGSTIITTVLQLLVNRIDRGLAAARRGRAPRGSPAQHRGVTAEPAFIDLYGDGPARARPRR